VKSQIIVFTGLPGTGKSSVAEAVARQLQIPIFAKDWLEAVLLKNGFTPKADSNTGYLGYELLTVLAQRQLMFGQSVILDSVASTESIRTRWRELAVEFGAGWKVIECVCVDEGLHRQRLLTRQRGIPGWHELSWDDIETVKGYYVPWREPRLILDMSNLLEGNVAQALAYLT
jgi:predicted kinase